MKSYIYEIIRDDDRNDKLGQVYDWIIILSILLSLIPLMSKETSAFYNVLDKVAVSVFILDYILRLYTADIKLKKGKKSFLIYPFTPMAIIDLLAILPSFTKAWKGLQLLRLIRATRLLRVFRFFKLARYSKSFRIIIDVIRKQKRPLLAVCILALAYIYISALVMFNVEPDTFDSFYDAIYWATVSLTTVGYGDLYPVSSIGKFVAMLSSVFGIAVVALPAGIITAGYMTEISKSSESDKD